MSKLFTVLIETFPLPERPVRPKTGPKAIPCLGEWYHSTEGSEYDCNYTDPPTCEDCFVNGGNVDPRDGQTKYICFMCGGTGVMVKKFCPVCFGRGLERS